MTRSLQHFHRHIGRVLAPRLGLDVVYISGRGSVAEHTDRVAREDLPPQLAPPFTVAALGAGTAPGHVPTVGFALLVLLVVWAPCRPVNKLRAQRRCAGPR